MAMNEYFIARILSKTIYSSKKEYLNNWFRKKGAKIGGGGCHIYSNIAKNEPHLISIGDNVTISGDVEFVTHDNSISKVMEGATDLFGRITIGSNCFVGTRSVILYGVSICDNVIIAAGSVVTKSVIKQKVIIAGNPARIISTWDDFKEKYKGLEWSLVNTSYAEMVKRTNDGEKLVSR